jgi:hypothetical protein
MSRWGSTFVSNKSPKEVCVIKHYYEEKMAWHDILLQWRRRRRRKRRCQSHRVEETT